MSIPGAGGNMTYGTVSHRCGVLARDLIRKREDESLLSANVGRVTTLAVLSVVPLIKPRANDRQIGMPGDLTRIRHRWNKTYHSVVSVLALRTVLFVVGLAWLALAT
jgi:hypothetical protein